MGRPRFTGILPAIAALIVPVSLVAATASPLETYKPRDLIQARYGHEENEFGFKNYGGQYHGALFFAVSTKGNIYLYDAVKGNIKLYEADGAFLETIQALPWQVGVLMPKDMTLTSDGDIYILCETANPDDKYKVFLTASGMDTVISVPVAVPWSFCRDITGYRVYSAAAILSDRNASVYLMDKMAWKSLKLVDEGKALPDSAQLSSVREGVVTSAGGFLSYRGRKSRTDTQGKLMVLDETGRLVKDLSHLRGRPLGTDSLGNIYLDSMEGRGKALFTRITKYSPDGRVLAVVDFPTSKRLTDTYGKGSRVLGTDGSIYEMIGARESVRVRKWERAQ